MLFALEGTIAGPRASQTELRELGVRTNARD